MLHSPLQRGYLNVAQDNDHGWSLDGASHPEFRNRRGPPWAPKPGAQLDQLSLGLALRVQRLWMAPRLLARLPRWNFLLSALWSLRSLWWSSLLERLQL
jgi:hypothetical protein